MAAMMAPPPAALVQQFHRFTKSGAYRNSIRAELCVTLCIDREACGLGCILTPRMPSVIPPLLLQAGVTRGLLNELHIETIAIMRPLLRTATLLLASTWLLGFIGCIFVTAGVLLATRAPSFSRGLSSIDAVSLLLSGCILIVLARLAHYFIECEFRVAETAAKAAAGNHVAQSVIPRWQAQFTSRNSGVYVAAGLQPDISDYNRDVPDEDAADFKFMVTHPLSPQFPPALEAKRRFVVTFTLGAPHQWPLYYDSDSTPVYRDEVAPLGSVCAVSAGPPAPGNSDPYVPHVQIVWTLQGTTFVDTCPIGYRQ